MATTTLATSAHQIDPVDLLSRSPAFAGLGATQLGDVAVHTRTTHWPTGRSIFTARQAPQALFILAGGSVRLSRDDRDGRQLTVAILDAGAVFGECALTDDVQHHVSAETIDESALVTISTDDVRDLIHRVPQIGVNLLQQIGSRLQRSQAPSYEMAYWSVRRRLSNQLESLADRYGTPTFTGGVVINRTFTQTDLAEMIGATRQTVSELLASLTRDGVLGQRRRRIVVLDAGALASFGDPSCSI